MPISPPSRAEGRACPKWERAGGQADRRTSGLAASRTESPFCYFNSMCATFPVTFCPLAHCRAAGETNTRTTRQTDEARHGPPRNASNSISDRLKQFPRHPAPEASLACHGRCFASTTLCVNTSLSHNWPLNTSFNVRQYASVLCLLGLNNQYRLSCLAA